MPSPPRVIAVQFDGLRADALSEENTPNLPAAAGRFYLDFVRLEKA